MAKHVLPAENHAVPLVISHRFLAIRKPDSHIARMVCPDNHENHEDYENYKNFNDFKEFKDFKDFKDFEKSNILISMTY